MQAESAKSPAPVFLFLLIPFGVSAGYASVTLAFLLAKAGLPTAAVALVVSFSIWPQTWKVLWAPLIDTTLNAKAWYVIGAVVTSLTILILSIIPATVANVILLGALLMASSLASTMVSMASELFMAHGVPDDRKGAVSGWSQAGNLGGTGVGGGLGLYLSQHAAPWVGGAALTVMCMACCLGLLFVKNPPPAEKRRYLDNLKAVGRDVWSVARSRAGFLVLILMLLPIGSGGAQGVWSAIGGEWKASPDVIALVNGVLGGVASLVGALIGGFVCDRMDRRTAYCLFGVALAAVATAMALGPRTPTVFMASTLAYAAVLGACYAGYSAAVLEAIGRGAAATKFNLLASVSNVPVAYMTALDGSAHDRLGTNGMLFGEAGIAIVAVLMFAALVLLSRRFPQLRKA